MAGPKSNPDNKAWEKLVSQTRQDAAQRPSKLPGRPLAARVLRVSLPLIGLVVLSFWLIYRSTQIAPDFHSRASAVPAEQRRSEADQFENEALNLQNDARTRERWQARFTAGQINSWLATDLVEDFPKTLPTHVKNPRVEIAENELSLAFQYSGTRFRGWVLATVDVFCTQKEGEIAIQIKSVTTGWIPIPVASVADEMTRQLRRFGISVQWTEIDGDQAGLLSLPQDLVKFGNRVAVLETVELHPQELVLSGTTKPIQNQ